MEFGVQLNVASFSAVQEVELIGHHARVEPIAAKLRFLELKGSCVKKRNVNLFKQTSLYSKILPK